MKNKILFIVGPTASGKSALAVALAKRINGEIISADSMQVYRGMDIGTAKPTRKERGGIRHHGIDRVPQSRNFSVFAWRQFALKTLRDILRRGKIPIVAGGTGFYVRALLEGLTPQPGADAAIRKKLEAEAREKGLPALFDRLLKRDPDRARKIGPHNQRRILRALEIYEVSGKKPSAAGAKTPGLRDLGYEPLVFGIHRDRQALYDRINARVDKMFRKGLVREVRRLMRKKFSQTALQGVGYKEVVEYLKKDGGLRLYEPKGSGRGRRAEGVKKSLSSSVTRSPMSLTQGAAVREKIKQTTRHFAKRQWTWFKREAGIRWVWWPDGIPAAKVADCVERMMANKRRIA